MMVFYVYIRRLMRFRIYSFKIGQNVIELVETYKYLGVIFQEKSDFTQTADALATGGGRAFGGLISKLHGLKDFGFKTFEKLYYSCVVPVTDYGSAVWGYKNYAQLDYIQNRAIRYFLGVHRFTPILALVGDSGWLPSQYRRWLTILRLWNRLILMDDSRLTKRLPIPFPCVASRLSSFDHGGLKRGSRDRREHSVNAT